MAGNAYTEYLKIDALLELQECRSQADSELLFITIHQADELWFKLLIHELNNAISALYAGEELRAYKVLSRVSRVQLLLTQSWDVLGTLTPTEYQVFRETVGRNGGSGFQSYQNRELEFLLGEKSRLREIDRPGGTVQVDIIELHDKAEVRSRLEARRRAPSLYDAVIHRIAAAFPNASLQARDATADCSTPRSYDEALARVWLQIYRQPEAHMSLYQLGEKLIDIEDAHRRWRFLHLTTVARIIGSTTGTGGSTGLRYLQKTAVEAMEQFLYPELWRVRNKIYESRRP